MKMPTLQSLLDFDYEISSEWAVEFKEQTVSQFNLDSPIYNIVSFSEGESKINFLPIEITHPNSFLEFSVDDYGTPVYTMKRSSKTIKLKFYLDDQGVIEEALKSWLRIQYDNSTGEIAPASLGAIHINIYRFSKSYEVLSYLRKKFVRILTGTPLAGPLGMAQDGVIGGLSKIPGVNKIIPKGDATLENRDYHTKRSFLVRIKGIEDYQGTSEKSLRSMEVELHIVNTKF